MPDLSTRINALIAYLFLGPIMLLAKSGTPLADPYVRGHAKRASLIIIVGAMILFIYRSLHPYLGFGIFGISADLIVISLAVSSILLILMVGAYRAYHGVSANDSSWRSMSLGNTLTEGSYSEEDCVRIIASYIPWIGIIIESIHPSRETLIGRKVGSLFACIILTTLVFFSGTMTTLMLILTLAYIATIVVTTVQLFVSSRFIEFSIYRSIPTYLELDAHIKASIFSIYDFCRIAFGGAKGIGYHERYRSILSRSQHLVLPESPYFAPIWLTGFPVANLITIPSLWQYKYREYVPLILQGLTLTIIMLSIIGIYGSSSQMGLYLLWPIITLIVGSKKNLNTRAPITSLAVDLYGLFVRGKEKIGEIKENGEEKVGYSYSIESK